MSDIAPTRFLLRLPPGLQATLALSDCRPVIHIQEHPYDNVGVDGELLSDLFPELVKRKFDYPLDRD